MNIRPRFAKRTLRTAVLTLAAIALVGSVTAARGVAVGNGPAYAVPRSAALEAVMGVRVSAVKVVGDNGIIQLDYVVLDAERASRFQEDVKHPPQISDSAHVPGGVVWRAALMKQAHALRPGQTYYILYQNQNNIVRRGDTVTIAYASEVLRSVPVE